HERWGRGQGGAARAPPCSDPRAPAPRPHPGSNPAGTYALNAATRVPASCLRPDYGWLLGGGRGCGWLAASPRADRPVHSYWSGGDVARNGPFPAKTPSFAMST